MKRFLAFLCVLALALSLVPGAAFAATQNLQAEIDAGAEETIVLEADASNVTISRDTTIDLNGHNIDGVSVLAGTLYLMDSQTADYTVADGVYGHVTGVTGAVKAADGYLQVGDSFHAVNLDIYAMTLRAADVGVYYKSHFAADEIVAAQVESFGVALSVVTAPNASNLETYCGYSQFTGFEAGEGANSVGTSTLLKGIMKAANGDSKNAKNAAMSVYGRAYIKTAEGYFFGETVKRSLQEQVEAIDGVWGKLTENQQAPVLGMLETYNTVMSAWNIPNILGGEAGEGSGNVEIEVPVTAENGVVTEAVTVEQGAISITVPAGTKLAEGVTQLTLTVTEKETSEAGLTLDKSEVLMPMDVHVEGLAADNAQPLTIYLGKVMAENLNMGNYTVYHVENGKANEMTLIGVNEEFTAHNQYKYTLDGELTLYMATFSEIAVRSNTINTWQGSRDYSWYDPEATQLYIRNADQLAGFSAIVGGMDGQTADDFAGKTVVLLADISIGDLGSENDVVFYPIGYYNSTGSYEKVSGGSVTSSVSSFEGTFDGNGNTVSDFYQNTWEMFGDYNDGYSGTPNHYKDAMGLFGYVLGGTVKNLTVDNFSSDGEFTPTGVITAYACNSTFENIAITNCNPRVYNTGNGGIVGIGGNSGDPDTYELTFNNITIDNTNIISALWGSWDVACGGLIGMFRGAGHVYMTNCHVAAQMDVNNDVCGNYQYYWYRYSGMLVGTNKNMITDGNGYTVPETEKFHAEACTVHFGTWNDYYYCELVENSLASYTHDHQFSRLTQINSLSEIKDGAGNWNKTGNYMIVSENKCYHIRKDAEGNFYQHKHEDAGTEEVSGETVLKEDKQRVYLPFNQLFTGYGWGVKHIPIYGDENQNVFAGVKILPRETADSVVKFEGLVENGAQYASGATLTIGDLFAAVDQEEATIVGDNVQVSVSPADDESTVSGIYTANKKDWTNGTLKLSGLGAATITITDYYFCTPTAVTVNVMPVAKVGEVEYALLQDALDAVEDGGTVTLLTDVTVYEYLDIHTPNRGETERSFTLDLDEHTITPAADYDYEWYPMIFVGINQTVTIKDGTIVPNEYVAVGAYGSVTLENVDIVRESEGEEVVCVWNWSESDKYYEDCPYHITGSATINGGNIVGGVIVEGPVTLNETANIDKLYLNTKTGYGKFILPSGYGLVNKGDYYADLHEHDTDGAEGACTLCGLAFYYVETDLSQIDSTDTVVITMTKDSTTWAMTNDNGTTDAPAATVVTIDGDKISGEVQSKLLWNISNIAGKLTIYQKGNADTWLYCNNDNNGLRVGDTTQSIDHNEFKISDEGYLYNVSQGRYVGVYMTNPDWRCYTSVNSNIEGQTLKFYVLRSNCQHSDEGRQENRERIEATCTAAGREAGLYCLNCDTYIENGALINATGHTPGDATVVKAATCTEPGKQTERCKVCNKLRTEKINALGHNFVDGECVNEGCNEKAPVNQYTYKFSEYTAGTQYAENEEHVLDDTVTIVTTQCHFTSELRIYSSSAHDGYVIIKSSLPIESITVNAGNKADTLNVYGSNDQGATWTLATTISVTSTSYKDYSASLEATPYTWLKLDVAGDNQVRLQSMTLTFGEESEIPVCEHTNTTTTTVDATCVAEGSTTVTCDDCGETISKETVAATGEHNYADGTCTECGAEDPNADNTEPGETTEDKKITFNLGSNGNAEHKDGSTDSTTYTQKSDGYTLSITSGTKMYANSYDAKGNSCIKLGAKNSEGGFSFTVPENVTSVTIYIAKYKNNTSKVKINGTVYTLSNSSDNGAYDAITIDTTNTKTITLTTVSGGYRAMVNTIEFIGKE